MSLESLMKVYLPAIEVELQRQAALTRQPGVEEMYAMLAYHMGWEGEGAGPEARGKRIRPLLVLLTAAAVGGEYQSALRSAAAVELIHNFSLIHDDIQDQSRLRRGRPTLWTLWGVAQAINAGDTLFTLAFMALAGLEQTVSGSAALRGAQILQQACLALTQGQYLDLAYEARGDLTLDAYWPMVSGKTAALLGACTQLGALAGGANEAQMAACQGFGRFLGLAFQVLDDDLGIWGDAALTGKSIESDLVSGKKSLPVLYGLGLGGPFARRWMQGPISAVEVAGLAAQLEAEGGREYTQQRANELTDQALDALREAEPKGEAGEALESLARKLLQRQA
jgi:geranylgeranyl diphosphate synthase, type I